MHRALKVEVMEHGPADQADQQRVPPCKKGKWRMCSRPRRDTQAHLRPPPRPQTPIPKPARAAGRTAEAYTPSGTG